MKLREKDDFQIIFRLGMLWRVVYGIAKVILGILILNFVGQSLGDVFYNLMSHEIIEDPNDLLVKTVSYLLNINRLDISYFTSIYLIFWGLLDSFLSISILRFRLWAYPVSLALISLFTLYEIYRLTYSHSLILLFVIIVDIFIIWIIKKEYTRLTTIDYRSDIV